MVPSCPSKWSQGGVCAGMGGARLGSVGVGWAEPGWGLWGDQWSQAPVCGGGGGDGWSQVGVLLG